MQNIIVHRKVCGWKTSTFIITKSSGIILGVVHDIDFDFLKINYTSSITKIKQVQGSAFLTK